MEPKIWQQQRVRLEDLLHSEDRENFVHVFRMLQPYDQASFFKEQPVNCRKRMYDYLTPRQFAKVMKHIPLGDAEAYLEEMETQEAARVLSEMPKDSSVKLLNEMDKEHIASYLALMDENTAAAILHLLDYDGKSAGGMMTTEFIAVNENFTVSQAMNVWEHSAADTEMIYYLYVLGDDGHLNGVLSLKHLIRSEPSVRIKDMMNTHVISVSAGNSQSEAARLMRDYDFFAIPVVDFQHHMLGVISVDDVLEYIDQEATEDYSKLAAVSGFSDAESGGPWTAAKKRLPWLIVLLFLGMFTASLIGHFEETLEKVAILAIFIPLISGMAGNTGTQSLAVAVRGLATGDIEKRGKLKMILSEGATGFINGTACAIVISLIIFVWKGQLMLGLVVASAILVALTVATLSGTLIPLGMNKLNIDPAVASGPFITTINDIISILIYFGVATAFMRFLV